VSIFNRRNAVAGWLALTIGKRVLKRKAKAAVAATPVVKSAKSRRGRGGIAFLAAFAVGLATFLRSRGHGHGNTPKGDDQ
jgi:hypothetical protein